MLKGQINLSQWWSKYKSNLSGSQRAKLDHYKELVLVHNPRLKMIAQSTESEFELAHTAEGAVQASLLDEYRAEWSIIDIGPGCGVPGVVLAILYENWKIRLVERADLRAAYLRTITKELGLNNVSVQSTELLPNDIAETACNLITHRAALAPDAWIKLLSRMLTADGYFAGYGSQKTHTELTTILKPTGRKLSKTIWYQMSNAAMRCVYLSTPEP